ncbi:mitochondrial ribosomal protein L27-domain-containing protein, partial [Chytridium lagenaria]
LGAKFGNKNWYKGTGSGSMGKWTKKGEYIIEPHKVRKFMIPDLNGFELTPYVDPKFTTLVRGSHSVKDYF